MGKIMSLAPLLYLIGLVLCETAAAQPGKPTIELITEPAASQLRPFGTATTAQKVPATLKLQARDAAGQPLQNARIRLQVGAPEPTPWFSTDFPWIEGQPLLDLTTAAARGGLQVQQILPIRGSYRLTATVAPATAKSFQPFQQQWTVPVAEHWDKYRNFGLLVGILVVAGFGGGWVLGGRQQRLAGEVAPQRVRLLLSGATLVAIAVLLGVNLSAELAPPPHKHSAPAGDRDPVAQGMLVQLSGDTEAIVGQPANLEVQILDAQTQQPATDVWLTLQVSQLEDNWPTFAYQGIPDQQGRLAWQQQFVDGAPHQLTVQVAPLPGAASDFPPFEISRTLEVTGMAPPLTRRLISLAYMSAVLTVSLLLGLALRHRLTALRLQTRSS